MKNRTWHAELLTIDVGCDSNNNLQMLNSAQSVASAAAGSEFRLCQNFKLTPFKLVFLGITFKLSESRSCNCSHGTVESIKYALRCRQVTKS